MRQLSKIASFIDLLPSFVVLTIAGSLFSFATCRRRTIGRLINNVEGIVCGIWKQKIELNMP